MILTVTPFSLPSQPPLHRVGGNLALDFANTVSWRATDRETDHIASPEGLARWAADNGLIDAGKHFPDDALATAHALRTAIRTVIEAAITQQNRPQAAAVILDVFKECLASARFEGSPARILFHASPADILGPIALAAVDLLRGGDMFARLRMCPQDDCHWLFLDMTKNKSRRWCDMASCGNRAKASQFRKRHAVGQNPGQGG